jgi:hypothetical protein
MRSDLTPRQITVLSTLEFGNPQTARNIGVRSDVLWRMEERGLVARNSDMDPRWSITGGGRAALIRYTERP